MTPSLPPLALCLLQVLRYGTTQEYKVRYSMCPHSASMLSYQTACPSYQTACCDRASATLLVERPLTLPVSLTLRLLRPALPCPAVPPGPFRQPG